MDIPYFPESIKTIEFKSFSDCNKLTTEINLPNLTTINYGAFKNTGITKITNLGNITNLNGYGGGDGQNGIFMNCSSLYYIDLPKGLEVIGDRTFQGCSSIVSLTLYDKISNIGAFSFYNCKSLKELVIKTVTPPSLGANAFTGTHSELKIYVPNESVEAYKTATNWNAYVSKIHPLSEYVPGE